MRKTADFCPFTAHFGGSRGVFSCKTDKSANLCPAKTEVADFVSFKGSIVQGVIPFFNYVFNICKKNFTAHQSC
jgi:hypothetical protein